MPRDWEAAIEDFSRVQYYVHYAARMRPEDATGIQNEIFKQKRLAYEDELTSQAAAVGCAGRKGVTSPVLLARMMEEARTEALGIANTYNYDLAVAIRRIRQETPTANRNVYAKRLGDWEGARNEWKSKQIMLWNTVGWQDQAVKDFLGNNPALAQGYAIVEPQATAVCDICVEWVGKGRVPIEQTKDRSFPVHLNCPHRWVIYYKAQADDCSKIWVGTTIEQYLGLIGQGKDAGEKGGPGSGNWGHAGRPGLVGGSASGGGRIRQRGGYLYTRRQAEAAKGVIGQVRQQLAESNPQFEDYEVESITDAMALDEERFNYYANRYGVTDVSADEFFAHIKEIDRAQARLRWELEEEAAMKIEGKPSHWMTLGTDITQQIESAARDIGPTWQEAADRLKAYNVDVSIRREQTKPGEFRYDLARLAVMAEQMPAFRQTLTDHVGIIEFTHRRSGTACAEYELLGKGTVRIYANDFELPTGVLAHEVGHAAERYVSGAASTGAMVRMDVGRVVSTYATKNYSESFAETFVAVLGGHRADAQRWVPEKVAFVEEVIGIAQ